MAWGVVWVWYEGWHPTSFIRLVQDHGIEVPVGVVWGVVLVVVCA